MKFPTHFLQLSRSHAPGWGSTHGPSLRSPKLWGMSLANRSSMRKAGQGLRSTRWSRVSAFRLKTWVARSVARLRWSRRRRATTCVVQQTGHGNRKLFDANKNDKHDMELQRDKQKNQPPRHATGSNWPKESEINPPFTHQ